MKTESNNVWVDAILQTTDRYGLLSIALKNDADNEHRKKLTLATYTPADYIRVILMHYNQIWSEIWSPSITQGQRCLKTQQKETTPFSIPF